MFSTLFFAAASFSAFSLVSVSVILICVRKLLLKRSDLRVTLTNDGSSNFEARTAIPRMLAPQFAQNFLQLFFENHTQIQCFDVKITINK